MALLNALRRMGFSKDEMTIHGFRATFSTILNEVKLEWGLDGDIIEAQLAHKDQNAVRSAYNHATYMEKRRQMLQRWVNWKLSHNQPEQDYAAVQLCTMAESFQHKIHILQQTAGSCATRQTGVPPSSGGSNAAGGGHLGATALISIGCNPLYAPVQCQAGFQGIAVASLVANQATPWDGQAEGAQQSFIAHW